MKEKVEKIIALVCVAVVVAAFFFLGRSCEAKLHEEEEPEISVNYIATRLESASDLATAKLEYRGLVRYEAGEIRFLTKKGFTMIYDAEIKAGIDLSQAQIALNDHVIEITLPAASIQDIFIDPDSLEFYDEKVALFNPEHKEDTVIALQEARKDAEQYAWDAELLTTADDQARRLVEVLLAPLTEVRPEGNEEAVPYTLNFHKGPPAAAETPAVTPAVSAAPAEAVGPAA